MEIEIKTNGYKLSDKTRTLINQAANRADIEQGLKLLRIFVWSEKLAFFDLILNNGHYGQFNASEKTVHFNGHTCTDAEYATFARCTWKDELYPITEWANR